MMRERLFLVFKEESVVFECDRAKNAGLIAVGNENASRWQNSEEGKLRSYVLELMGNGLKGAPPELA